MGNRNHDLAPGEFYHVFNRGVDKRIIYQDHTDYRRFLDLLFLCNTNKAVNVRDVKKTHSSIYDFDRSDSLVSIGAYCLMLNHFHLLISPIAEDGVSIFIKKVATSYSMYFNKRHERNGALFQGKFKSQHASTDEYLKYLYAYIHLNPTKLHSGEASAVHSFIANYPYSSLHSYLTDSPDKQILDPAAFPEYFSIPADHLFDLNDWLSLGPS